MKKDNGITLIALIVTIIVLIILSAITIIALTGDNNILDDAQLARCSNSYYGADDMMKLSSMAVYSKIQVNTSLNSTYNAAANVDDMVDLVAKDLSGNQFKFAVKKGTADASGVITESTIYVEYTDANIQGGAISKGDSAATPAVAQKPRQDTVVYASITLTPQKSSYEFDIEKPADAGDFKSYSDIVAARPPAGS